VALKTNIHKEIKDKEKPEIESKKYFELYKNGFNHCLKAT